jgi:hypothetical protein
VEDSISQRLGVKRGRHDPGSRCLLRLDGPKGEEAYGWVFQHEEWTLENYLGLL